MYSVTAAIKMRMTSESIGIWTCGAPCFRCRTSQSLDRQMDDVELEIASACGNRGDMVVVLDLPHYIQTAYPPVSIPILR